LPDLTVVHSEFLEVDQVLNLPRDDADLIVLQTQLPQIVALEYPIGELRQIILFQIDVGEFA
jgi:hypothetical protein